MTDAAQLTISEASGRLADGRLTAVDLLDSVLGRIDRIDGVLSSYASLQARRARQDAEALDRELANGKNRGPLHGIPVSVKDIIYSEGSATEAGSATLAGFASPYEATVVGRLRQAGAIILGKAVTHEFASGRNEPPTRNPWKPDDYYAGSSSVGSAVSVAARLAFASIGTDTGGSVRFPSAINGVVGLKPTYGRVSKHGVIPLCPSLDHVGPITRTALDAALVLDAIAGYDAKDPASIDEPVPAYSRQIGGDIKGLRIGAALRGYYADHVAPEVMAATEGVLTRLAAQDADIVDIDGPEADMAGPVWMMLYVSEAAATHRYLLRRPALYDPVVRLTFELGEFVSASQYQTAQRLRTVFRDRMRNLFGRHGLDAIIAPGLPLPAVRNADLYGTEGAATLPAKTSPLAAYLHHTFPVNLTGQPCLFAPSGFSADGLPLSYQIIGRPFDETTILRIAHAHDRVRPWDDRAPPV